MGGSGLLPTAISMANRQPTRDPLRHGSAQRLQQIDHRLDYPLKGFLLQGTHLGCHQALARGEQLPRPRVAPNAERARGKVVVGQKDSARVGEGAAGNLAQNPSPRPASANTTAGRSFDCERSEKGKRTSTTSPIASAPMLGPPPGGSNLRQGPLR